jgi:hypothetical protein
MPKKKKHPMHMTDEEALKHLFHKDIVKAVRRHVKEADTGPKPQVTRKKKG